MSELEKNAQRAAMRGQQALDTKKMNHGDAQRAQAAFEQQKAANAKNSKK